MVLRHLPCSEMQFLSMPPENLLLEPSDMNHFFSRHELCTEDDGDLFFRVNSTRQLSPFYEEVSETALPQLDFTKRGRAPEH